MNKIMAIVGLLALAACGGIETEASPEGAPEVETESYGLCATWNQSGTFFKTSLWNQAFNCPAGTPTLYSGLPSPIALTAVTDDATAQAEASLFLAQLTTGATCSMADTTSSTGCGANATNTSCDSGISSVVTQLTFISSNIIRVMYSKATHPGASGSSPCFRQSSVQWTRSGP